MTGDQYLYGILAREAVNTGPNSPVCVTQAVLRPITQKWAGDKLLTIILVS